jgi:hypothetical protein
MCFWNDLIQQNLIRDMNVHRHDLQCEIHISKSWHVSSSLHRTLLDMWISHCKSWRWTFMSRIIFCWIRSFQKHIWRIYGFWWVHVTHLFQFSMLCFFFFVSCTQRFQFFGLSILGCLFNVYQTIVGSNIYGFFSIIKENILKYYITIVFQLNVQPLKFIPR